MFLSVKAVCEDGAKYELRERRRPSPLERGTHTGLCVEDRVYSHARVGAREYIGLHHRSFSRDVD